MEWNEIVQVAANIATIAATIVAILTIREMGKDRRASRQPELIIRNNEEMILLNEIGLNTKWTNSSIYYNKEVEYGSNQCFLRLENIGLGVAKNIKITWIFNCEKFEEQIINKSTEFRRGGFGDSKTFEWCCNNDIPTCVTMDIGDVREQNIEFLSANHENVYKEKVFLPSNYCSMFSSLLYIEGDKEDFMRLTLEPPKLTCKIEYYDVGGIKYTKKYELKFQLFNAIPNNASIIDHEIVFEDGYDGEENIPGAIVKIEQT